MKNDVSVEEYTGLNVLRKHLVDEEPGGGAEPEHAHHVLQPPGIGEVQRLETELYSSLTSTSHIFLLDKCRTLPRITKTKIDASI